MDHDSQSEESRISYTNFNEDRVDFEQRTQELDALLRSSLGQLAARPDAGELAAEVEANTQSSRDMAGLMARGELLSRLAGLADADGVFQNDMEEYHPEVSSF